MGAQFLCYKFSSPILNYPSAHCFFSNRQAGFFIFLGGDWSLQDDNPDIEMKVWQNSLLGHVIGKQKPFIF